MIANLQQNRTTINKDLNRFFTLLSSYDFQRHYRDQQTTKRKKNQERLAKKRFIIDFEIIMSRLQKLLEKELNKPHDYNELKKNPFPYLEECNRLQIFEFIFQLQAQKQQLLKQINQRYPGMSIEQCMKEHTALQAKKKLIEINKQTIDKMNIEIGDKISQIDKLKERNNALQIQSQELAKSYEKFEIELIDVEKERRFLEMKLKMQEERASKNVDLSAILTNLYKEVKQTLNQSL